MKGEYEIDIYVVVSAQIASDYGNDPSITLIGYDGYLPAALMAMCSLKPKEAWTFSLQQEFKEMCRNFKTKVIFLILIYPKRNASSLSSGPELRHIVMFTIISFSNTRYLSILPWSELISAVRLGY